MIIGLSGYARSGKDTVGTILVEQHGFKRVSFADQLRKTLLKLDPYLVVNEECHWASVPRQLSSLQEHHGTLEAVKGSEYSDEWRRLQQRMGTEVGRDMFGENVWVDMAMREVYSGDNTVVTDCRFLNEAVAIRKESGKVWRVTRPGVGPANQHISETGLDFFDFDELIDNDGSLEELALRVKVLL